ncbi:MAG: hypothetical protein IBJ04_06235 [Hydrogenophaga sp.]|uniref:hypothetical protein n=1 Tax=Hydrogenophaga sp. TaxID=1904254 RepID=UPI00257C6FF2|nr:hypothetical protein [Hydrogenophaga sp.]MBL0943910.1 hypothetical protein [Hydrogenophaga sp.]
MSQLLDHLAQAEAGPWPTHDHATPAAPEAPAPLSARFTRWAWAALAAVIGAFGLALLLLPVPTP